MSLLFFDSFKNYTFIPLKWEERTTYCLFSIEENVGRKNGSALTITSGHTHKNYDFIGKYLGGNYEEVILGFAFKKVLWDTGHIDIRFCDDDTIQSRVRLFNTGYLWENHDNSVNYGQNYSLQFDEWNYVEIKLKAHTVSGTVNVRVNENLAFTLTDQSTSASANNYINKIRISCQQAENTGETYAHIEDLYISNTLGTTNNDFLGNCEVVLAYPVSQGDHEDFDPSPTYSGVDNYTIINEQVHVEDNVNTYSNTFLVYSNADDGSDWEQGGTNYFSNTGSYLPNGNYYINSSNNFTATYWWWRYSRVDIPRNAKITNAQIYAYVHTKSGLDFPDSNEQLIRAVRSGTPAPVPEALGQASDMDYCYAYRSDTLGAYLDENNVNIKELIQELVDLPDWQEFDNQITLVVRHNYTNADDNWVNFKYRGYNYFQDPFHSQAPKLTVTWEMPSGDSNKYLHTDHVGEKDTYSMSTLSGTVDIFAINHSILSKRYKDSANSDDMAFRSLVTVSDTTYSGAKVLPDDMAYSCSSNIDEINPATGTAWLHSDLKDTQFGFVTTMSG